VTTISDLEIFARVARTGNMSAAGREMGLSPAVVSKRVSLLEDRLGARLFHRTTRQLTLTETGEGYFKRVVDILSLVEEADDFVSRRNTKPRGALKVTAPTTFTRLHLAPVIPAFLERYPDIELDMHLTDNFVDIIRNGVDVAIRIGELADSSLVAKKLSPDRRVICASPEYLRKAGVPKTLADLNIRSNSAELIREALLSGQGMGLRSLWEIGNEIKSGALEIVLPQYRGSSNHAIHAVYPCREFMPAKVSAFIDFVSEYFSLEPYWEKGIDLGTQRPSKAAVARASRRSGPL
jgi:DNA-binding transcriptional LysR family regulator